MATVVSAGGASKVASPPFRRTAFAVLVACALAAEPAVADIYTWTDAQGRVNVSNLEPPKDAIVTKVYRQDPAAAARAETAREAARDAELRVLSERVRELERELDLAGSRVAAMPPYPPFPSTAPVPVPYPVPFPVAQPYAEASAPVSTASCDLAAWGCSGFVNPWYYAPPAVVVAVPFAPGHPGFHRPPRPGGHPGAPGAPGFIKPLPVQSLYTARRARGRS